MLDRQVARKLAEEADIRTFPTCAMCLFDLACTVLDGRTVHPGLVTRTANWVWLESADASTPWLLTRAGGSCPAPRRRFGTWTNGAAEAGSFERWSSGSRGRWPMRCGRRSCL